MFTIVRYLFTIVSIQGFGRSLLFALCSLVSPEGLLCSPWFAISSRVCLSRDFGVHNCSLFVHKCVYPRMSLFTSVRYLFNSV